MTIPNPPSVRVDVVEIDSDGFRQISAQERLTEQLERREADVQAAIQMASRILRESVAADPGAPANEWRVSELEAKFGITLTAEAGVIVSKASAQATFEVVVKMERG